ncbi:lysine transporter LysE [Pseudomonas putida]|nr:lysine transporter LysE [Pseudomonas putida]
MPDAANLYLFVIAAALLLIVPGPNMAFVTSHALAHGWRTGVAAALGISLADLIMTLLVSAGMGAVVMSWAPAFDLLRLAGACYLLWMAWQALTAPTAQSSAPRPLGSTRKVFIRATLNSLLNPKALLFFMVFLPQFVTVGNASVVVQLSLLGMLLALIALVFHCVLALCAATLRKRLNGGPALRKWGSYGFAGMMTALAARLLFLERPL